MRPLEEAYVVKDPFTPDKGQVKLLIAGSHCSLCSRAVTVVLFHSKSFCPPCVKENLKAFPLEIQEDMDKRKSQQKSCKTNKQTNKQKQKNKKRIQSINLEGPRETFLWLGFLLSLLGDYHVAPFKEVTFISSPLLERAEHFLALGSGSDIPVQRRPRQAAAPRC
ncbi:cysteine-rich DPF motif domain-containing protein 1 [Sylvia borin]